MLRDVGQRRTFVLLTQVFVPDPASVGQHMADTAEELVRRGHRVVVLTSDRGYDDPSRRYDRRETVRGAEVIRLPWSWFGKSSIAIRLLGGSLFLLQAILRSLVIGRVDGIVVSTTPPIAPLGALVIAALKRASIIFWVMDLNPDQMVAMGLAAPTSRAVRVFDWMNRLILRRAKDVVVLDRFMEARVRAKGPLSGSLHVLPPWPLEDVIDDIPHEANAWREAQGLRDEIVVMYSGNHSPANPLGTILEAAHRLRDVPGMVFLFVGGGAAKREVEALVGPTIRSLPYQPLEVLPWSLSAADVHLVSVGDNVVGIVHPCKVYGAMAVGRPVIALGPSESHVADIVDNHAIGWRITHGDVEAAERTLRGLLVGDRARLREMGQRARSVVQAGMSRRELCGRLCDIIERGLASNA